MTPSARTLPADLPAWGRFWLDGYLAAAERGDVLRADVGRGARWWHHLLDGVAGLTEGRLRRLQDRVQRQVTEFGTAFRLPGDGAERPWPLSALPLLIGEDEWAGIAAGVAQRAELMERLLADLYGPASLVREGALPAAAVTGSRSFWRQMIGVAPPGGHRLHLYAVDLGRGPDGEWRVLADQLRGPVGAGYALENRLAANRVTGALQTRLNLHRLAPFFAAFRAGLGAVCARADPRIGLLTPGRYNPSYAEQAHLARYLGLTLVEGDDLAVRGDRLYVRTVEGLKRVDALWRRLDTRFLDPLAFDVASRIGVPGLADVLAAGNVVVANAPGVGVGESPALAAFLPRLARRLLGEELLLPTVATWWCGQEEGAAELRERLDELLVAPAFHAAAALGPAGMLGRDLDGPARARLLADLARRPHDYVAREVVRLSTMPAIAGDRLVPRPFTLRAFAARDADGRWQVMPGGFARLGDRPDDRATIMGEGAFSADVGVVALAPVEPYTLLPRAVAIRRNPGTLPSRAADNLFWLGRYLERGDATLRLVRATLGGTLDADAGASLVPLTLDRLATMLLATGAATLPHDEGAEEGAEDGAIRDLAELAAAALDGPGPASIRSLFATVHTVAEGLRERLSAEVWRLVEAGLPPARGHDAGATLARVGQLQERFAALAGLAAENMGRTAGWRFHDLGRRIERGMAACRLLRAFAPDSATADDLTALLDLSDSQISYRARYLTGLALVPVRDLVALDPSNPRSLAFQVARIREHLAALPPLRDDGLDEEPVQLATELGFVVATARPEALAPPGLLAIEARLMALSDAVGRRFFLQGAETLRAAGMTLA